MPTKPKRNRRPLNAREQWKPQLTLPQVEDTFQSTISITVEDPLMGVLDPETGPYVTQSSVEKRPSSITLADPTTLVLTFSPPLNTGSTILFVPKYWEGARTFNGGYIAPLVQSITVVSD